jgi:hypothetical protein
MKLLQSEVHSILNESPYFAKVPFLGLYPMQRG